VDDERNKKSEPAALTPPLEVVELARSGNRLEAIRRYRELRGGSYEEAQAAIREV
jgi:hypothetical protein